MKYVLILLLVVSAAIILIMGKTNNQLRFKLEQQKQEIEASSRYIELLTEEILENNSANGHQGIDYHKISELLRDYLEDGEVVSEVQSVNVGHNKNIFLPDLVPVIGEYVVSQGFKDEHTAIDLAASIGTQVVASATGEIVSIKQDKYFGNMVVIDHFNGYVSVYAHLAKILTEEGTIVKKGMNIGLVGSTGNSSGPHLHFEIILNGESVDPEELIDFNNR
jgi:murein DD-endopeptidase MepM/ murein hydrolase activator NlpD